MKKIDTTYWEEFRVGDLFKAERGCVKKLQTLEKGSTPVIAAARSRQGVAGFYSVDAPYCDKITISCNGVGCGSTFYHDYPFNVNGDALVLTEKVEVSKEAKIYLACIFDGYFSRKYSYAEKCSPQKAIEEKILLPATPAGEPDWHYMEMYMRRIEQRTQTAISALIASKNNPRKIDTTYWQEFELSSIFDIVLSKGDIQAKRMNEGDIPLVSSGKFNNGICAHIADGDGKAEIFDGNVITTDMFGKSYYQSKPFYAVSHGRVNILIPRYRLNQYIALYLISVLDSSFSSRYSFTGMCSQSQLKQEKILLPATPAGEPDWHYMEMYMRGVEAMVKEKLSVLIPHKPEVAIKDAAVVNFNGANVTYIDNSKTFNVEK